MMRVVYERRALEKFRYEVRWYERRARGTRAAPAERSRLEYDDPR
jgi:plasmid stabilization system protein ParE